MFRPPFRRSLSHPVLGTMNFLNEVVASYPKAISFGPGRPPEAWFDVPAALAHVGGYATAVSRGGDIERTLGRFGQYGETNGFIREDIARYLERDEGIAVSPANVLVTVGCQEAILLLLIALFDPSRDTILMSDPTYVGISGPATMLGIPICPVAHDVHGLDPEAVAAAARSVRAEGRVPRALYHVPSFNNPLGTLMPLDARRRLLEVAAEHDLLIIEDDAYGAFSFDGERTPSIASLDTSGHVVYLGSFSKTIFPGLRVGFMVHRDAELIATLGQVKSFTTVNTSPLMQAVVGGVLRTNNFTLREFVEPKRQWYRRQRDTMLDALEQRMSGAASGVTWNRPTGGFFLSVTLPFEFDDECLRICAADYGVICSPMRYFTMTSGWRNVIRLSYSYVSPEDIQNGISKLAAFVAARQAQ